MKSAKVLFISIAFMIFACASAQQANRGVICQSIPGLTAQQQQKIDNLSVTHQKKMDDLRLQFRSESNTQQATNLKSQMNTEMQNHYQNITSLLSAEQKTWYDQKCSANDEEGSYARKRLGRSGQVYGRGQGTGRGEAYGAGRGNGYRAGRGRGYRAGRG